MTIADEHAPIAMTTSAGIEAGCVNADDPTPRRARASAVAREVGRWRCWRWCRYSQRALAARGKR
ncbi:hypothetical protein [Lysobacter gummosus]|uniref:hypothetical protein n=1 Tax=Lysobacter gummosus TaxID=262324 RepID=UPI0036358654